jgi:hypothetical protein
VPVRARMARYHCDLLRHLHRHRRLRRRPGQAVGLSKDGQTQIAPSRRTFRTRYTLRRAASLSDSQSAM